MRVAIITPYSGSIIAFRAPLIKDMIARGIQVYVLAPDYTLEIKEKVRAFGAYPIDYLLNRTGMNPFRDLFTLFQLLGLFLRLKPDAILPYSIKPVLYGIFSGALAGVPKRIPIITGLGYVFIKDDHFSIKKVFLALAVKWLYRITLNFAHKVIFLNADDLTEFIESGLVDPKKARMVRGEGIPLDEWQVSPPVVLPVTFMMASRLLREKGVLEYADAARAIKERYPKSRFLLLGDVDANPGSLTRKDIQRWEAERILEWPGFVQDVGYYLSKTSVYVLPSYREGVPRSTLEAMAMSRPIITTDVPGCRETVIDGVNGFLVPSRNFKALAEAMERFILNPDLIDRMGKESRKLAEERFDVKKINAQLIEEICS